MATASASQNEYLKSPHDCFRILLTIPIHFYKKPSLERSALSHLNMGLH